MWAPIISLSISAESVKGDPLEKCESVTQFRAKKCHSQMHRPHHLIHTRHDPPTNPASTAHTAIYTRALAAVGYPHALEGWDVGSVRKRG
jgi:hypothetical protein